MKKTIICLLFLLTLLVGCTSKEQDEKIDAFWAEQVGNLMLRIYSHNMPMHVQNPNKFAEMNKDLFDDEIPELDPNAEIPFDQLNIPAAQETADVPQVFLFLNPSCPWCQRLKKEGWIKDFRRKYRGKVELVEYDLSTKRGEEAFIKLLHKHKLTQVGTPVLFVGDRVVQSYPLDHRVDEAVEILLAKQGADAQKPSTQNTGTQRPKTQKTGSQKPYMQIVMEEPVKNTVNTKASAQDKQSMQNAFAQVQANNKKTLNDIGAMFGSDTQMQALNIISATERSLKKKMGTSSSYKAYQEAQTSLLKEQEKKLNELMRSNSGKIRSL